MPLGVRWGQNVGHKDFYHILTVLPPGAWVFHKYVLFHYVLLSPRNALRRGYSNAAVVPSVRASVSQSVRASRLTLVFNIERALNRDLQYLVYYFCRVYFWQFQESMTSAKSKPM